MKQPADESISKAEDAIKNAHKERQGLSASPIWHAQVMTQIRSLDTSKYPIFSQRLVWRFAAATCLIALVLSLYAVTAGLNPDDVMSLFFLEDPAGFVITQPFIP